MILIRPKLIEPIQHLISKLSNYRSSMVMLANGDREKFQLEIDTLIAELATRGVDSPVGEAAA
jgi:hypothetical protein